MRTVREAQHPNGGHPGERAERAGGESPMRTSESLGSEREISRPSGSTGIHPSGRKQTTKLIHCKISEYRGQKGRSYVLFSLPELTELYVFKLSCGSATNTSQVSLFKELSSEFSTDTFKEPQTIKSEALGVGPRHWCF